MKKIFYIVTLSIFALVSCQNNEIDSSIETIQLSQQLPENMINLSNRLLEISQTTATTDVYQSVMKSLEYGLDETMFIDEVESSNKSRLKSMLNQSVEDVSIVTSIRKSPKSSQIDGLEVFWPYSENWDGKTSPVVVCSSSSSDSCFVGSDKVKAYKYKEIENGQFQKDSILVDEAYAKKSPVWIIKKASLDSDDLARIFNGQPTKSGVEYVPRNRQLLNKSLRQSVVSQVQANVIETKITSIKSTTQHDTWIAGGSEFVLYWFFPTADFGLSMHKSEQICLTRKEIDKGTVRSIDFNANYDWFSGQAHNRLKVIEYDPGKDMTFDVKISTTYKPKDSETTINGEFKTTIKLNKEDDEIMEETIPRTAMFTTLTKVNDRFFQKSFSKNGVTLVVSATSVDGISL